MRRNASVALRTSSTTSNAEIAGNPYAPRGFRRLRSICSVGAPHRCPASPSSRERNSKSCAALASAPAALGTRPIVLLPRAAKVPHPHKPACFISNPNQEAGIRTRVRRILIIAVFVRKLFPVKQPYPIAYCGKRLQIPFRKHTFSTRIGNALIIYAGDSVLDKIFRVKQRIGNGTSLRYV